MCILSPEVCSSKIMKSLKPKYQLCSINTGKWHHPELKANCKFVQLSVEKGRCALKLSLMPAPQQYKIIFLKRAGHFAVLIIFIIVQYTNCWQANFKGFSWAVQVEKPFKSNTASTVTKWLSILQQPNKIYILHSLLSRSFDKPEQHKALNHTITRTST